MKLLAVRLDSFYRGYALYWVPGRDGEPGTITRRKLS